MKQQMVSGATKEIRVRWATTECVQEIPIVIKDEKVTVLHEKNKDFGRYVTYELHRVGPTSLVMMGVVTKPGVVNFPQ